MSSDNPYDAPPNLDYVSYSEDGYWTIRRIDPATTARMLAAIYALLGLALGVFFSLAALLGQANNNVRGAPTMVFGVAAVLLMPILYGALGAVGGLIGAYSYNAIAAAVGGIRIQVSR